MELDEDDEDDEFNYCNSYPKSENLLEIIMMMMILVIFLK